MPNHLPLRRSKLALRAAEGKGDLKTVLIALAGNLIIAIAKLIAGLFSGSAAMLAEAAHSFADSINEILLGVSLMSSRKSADAAHPFGYGRERFLWAFLAAITSFVVGGCVSIGLAIREFSHPERGGSVTVSAIVLAIAFVTDSVSWFQGVSQARKEAGERKQSVMTHLRSSSDPVVRAVIFEDSAGLVGTTFAAAGLFLSKWLGSSLPDAIASLLIGLLLAVTAIGLARPLADFLIGRSLPDVYLKEVRKLFKDSPAISRLVGLQAVYTGPGEVIVAAKINPKDMPLSDFARAMDELDHKIRTAVPLVADIFVDVTCWNPDEPHDSS